MNYIYYILIGVIALVIAIDFYVKSSPSYWHDKISSANKNKKSDSTDIDKFKESVKKKKKNSTLFFCLAFLFTILSVMIFLHIQHQSVRNQFETNLESISELLENHKYDYCDSIVNKNKTDLINNSNANKLKYNFNGSYYKSEDLINYSDSLIRLIVELNKDYAKKEKKRKQNEKINNLIDSFITKKNKLYRTFPYSYLHNPKEEFELLWKNDLFPILYKILKIDNKNKFALYHLGDINATIGHSIKNRELANKLLREAEGYGKKLLEFYPKYWGGDKILAKVNHAYYENDNRLVNVRVMRSYSTNVINKIGVPKNNWEKAVLFMVHGDRIFANQELDNYRAIYNDALYLSQIGEIFVYQGKYLESKVFNYGGSGTSVYRNYGSWDPSDYEDY